MDNRYKSMLKKTAFGIQMAGIAFSVSILLCTLLLYMAGDLVCQAAVLNPDFPDYLRSYVLIGFYGIIGILLSICVTLFLWSRSIATAVSKIATSKD